MLRQNIALIFFVATVIFSLLLLGKGLSSEKQQETLTNGHTTPPRIAIIGGGLGGTSSAYFLSHLFGQDSDITVYERDAIGGRLATVSMAGREYEIGGSVIHPKNMYMKNFVTEFGLKKSTPRPSATLGIYNGQEFVFQESSWTVITFCKLLWRYGFDVLRMQWTIESLLKQFAKIYDLQDSGESFITVEEVMSSLGGEEFVNWLTTPVESVLKSQGFSDRFIDEIVSIATRVNYGQSTQMSAFAGMVSLAGAQPGLWSVEGGNRHVPQELLKRSEASYIHATVTGVEHIVKNGSENPFFGVTYSIAGNNATNYDTFDIIIVATPLQAYMSSIQFTGFDPPIRNASGQYRETFATLVKGHVNASTFGATPGQHIPDDIITNIEIPWNFRSVTPNYPVDFNASKHNATNQVYKVFSTKVLNETQMTALFASYSATSQHDWLAYPYYLPCKTFPSFVLADGVFYSNAIEWAASTMEMSVIGGRNVALLAQKYWTKNVDSRTMVNQNVNIKQEL